MGFSARSSNHRINGSCGEVALNITNKKMQRMAGDALFFLLLVPWPATAGFHVGLLGGFGQMCGKWGRP